MAQIVEFPRFASRNAALNGFLSMSISIVRRLRPK